MDQNRGIIILLAFLLEGCVTPPPQPLVKDPAAMAFVKKAIVGNKHKMWKDHTSITNASIEVPLRTSEGWTVCISSNAKNSFGGYTGLKSMIVLIKADGAITSTVEANLPCEPTVPFKELEG